MAKRAWTDAERRRVKAMLRNCKSMGKIAKVLGLTRNMVIGRVSRDGELQPFVAKVVLPIVPPLEAAHKPHPVPTVHAFGSLRQDPPGATGAPRPMVELVRDDCRWPVEAADVPGGQLFCGRPRLGEWTHYCREHHAIAHHGDRRHG